jgi:TonB family protein
MNKTFTTWAPPVASSLLLHTALLTLIFFRLSVSNPVPVEVVNQPVQSLSVQLNIATVRLNSKPLPPKNTPLIEPKPVVIATPAESPIIVPEVIPEKNEPEITPSVDRQPITPDLPPTITSNASSQTIYPLSKLSRAPGYSNKIEPVYPNAEKHSGSQATVQAEVTIDEKGNVTEVRIVKSAGIYFDNAVIEALNKSHFKPGYLNQDPVASRVIVPFRFKLN